MTQHGTSSQQPGTEEPGGKPSQAEGEREGAESTTDTTTDVPGGKPSQAEGDRETVEQDLAEKGR